MSIKQEMQRARKLIQNKRYDEARVILEKINHPKAQEWLAKVNKISPPEPEASSGGRLIRLLLGIAIIAVVVVAVIFVFNSMNDDDGDSSADNSQSGGEVVDAPQDTQDVDDSQPKDEEDAPGEAGDNGVSEQIGTGAPRISYVNGDVLITVDLPQGWVCDCGTTSGRLEATDDTRGRIDIDPLMQGFDIDAMQGVTLDDALEADLDDDEVIASQEELRAGARDLWFATIVDDDGDEEFRYYVKDSDDHVIRLEVRSASDDPSEIMQELQLVAATVEVEGGESAAQFSEQLLATAISQDTATNRWTFPDTLNDMREHTVELPLGWMIARNFIGFPLLVKDGLSETSATAVTYIPGFFDDDTTLADVVQDFNEGSSDVIVEGSVVDASGREVYSYLTRSEVNESETQNYLVRDSDGDFIMLIIQPSVVDKATLHADVLFMAGNIESGEVDYVERLARAGLIE